MSKVKASEQLLEEHKALFSEGLGTLNDYKATFQIDDTVRPKYCKARPVLYAMKSLVEGGLCKEAIIEPVSFSEWAAPIVPILKPDRKSIRICGDFKLTISQASKLDRYPIPKVEDLLVTLAGDKNSPNLTLVKLISKYVWQNKPSSMSWLTRIKDYLDIPACHTELHLPLASSRE